eukprot:CAMPEP_0178453956 /NCGR_PEP_ID=MMETSP0689_2-20121128/45090_1 /TAXON_ID=160604 /ORGANISM="Amphidinium massartii, Strain CS-259" /LENGTH=55 /DNA_ID=CAMNT_0020079835 /DNA_START=655 /DNA_END=819 /DNA_ORIENTATION=+
MRPSSAGVPKACLSLPHGVGKAMRPAPAPITKACPPATAMPRPLAAEKLIPSTAK